MQTLNVDLAERSYPIYIGAGALNTEHLQAHISGKQVMIVTNDTVAPLYLQQIENLLSDQYQVDTVILPDGEAYKNIDQIKLIYDALLSKPHNRTTTLIALGGGVIGDMTGFAAASYQRGVNFIQIPTTLLAQVDSSVGGKTGVNHALGKNMIGAFHQPQAVIIDTLVLTTLPARQLSAGLAEVIKYGLIYDVEFLNWLEANLNNLLEYQNESLIEAIYRSCEIKAKIVAADEKEQGIRAWLNLGHTFGHAIETHQGYGNWLHGEAISAGMMMAANLSERLGSINSDEVDRIRTIFSDANLPTQPPENMTPEDFQRLMAVDKKVIDSKLRLILLEKLGTAKVTSDFGTELLADCLNTDRY